MRSYGRGVPEVGPEPMSDEEYAEFRERSEVSYSAEIAASRAVPLLEARLQEASAPRFVASFIRDLAQRHISCI